jgi:hypothetical protein
MSDCGTRAKLNLLRSISIGVRASSTSRSPLEEEGSWTGGRPLPSQAYVKSYHYLPLADAGDGLRRHRHRTVAGLHRSSGFVTFAILGYVRQ